MIEPLVNFHVGGVAVVQVQHGQCKTIVGKHFHQVLVCYEVGIVGNFIMPWAQVGISLLSMCSPELWIWTLDSPNRNKTCQSRVKTWLLELDAQKMNEFHPVIGVQSQTDWKESDGFKIYTSENWTIFTVALSHSHNIFTYFLLHWQCATMTTSGNDIE